MAKRQVPALLFIGRPFSDHLMDSKRTFSQPNIQMEKSTKFQSFLQQVHLTEQRTNLIVYGPEDFMYWYGVVLSQPVKHLPQGLFKYRLPKATVGQEVRPATLNWFSQPLNYVIPTFFNQLRKEGIKVYQNPGDSETPYFMQTLNLATKKLTQRWYFQAGQ